MDYEWDETKRQKTLVERGLNFADIASVDWDEAITIIDTRQPYPEERFITMAFIANQLCVFAWCYRGENIRVISLRNANKKERERYAKEQERGVH